jgi:uncharacterized protein (DUF1499 family)
MSLNHLYLPNPFFYSVKRYILFMLLAMLVACAADRPDNLGLVLGKLTPCPATPNCVSSESTDEQHKIAPLQGTIEAIKQVLLYMDDAKIIVDNTDYLHAEFTSPILGFVDDVEFYAPQAGQKTQLRSASRLGRSDMGINRERIETIRLALKQ